MYVLVVIVKFSIVILVTIFNFICIYSRCQGGCIILCSPYFQYVQVSALVTMKYIIFCVMCITLLNNYTLYWSFI